MVRSPRELKSMVSLPAYGPNACIVKIWGLISKPPLSSRLQLPKPSNLAFENQSPDLSFLDKTFRTSPILISVHLLQKRRIFSSKVGQIPFSFQMKYIRVNLAQTINRIDE